LPPAEAPLPLQPGAFTSLCDPCGLEHDPPARALLLTHLLHGHLHP
jgi:hypothetical protein